jgi:RNA-directed DNA polymerase
MWLSQRYYSVGRASGHAEELLDNAVASIERLVARYPDLPPLLSLNHLAIRLGLNYKTLRAFVSRSAPDSYRHFYVRKRSGGSRRISVPTPTLMLAQKWISSQIL